MSKPTSMGALGRLASSSAIEIQLPGATARASWPELSKLFLPQVGAVALAAVALALAAVAVGLFVLAQPAKSAVARQTTALAVRVRLGVRVGLFKLVSFNGVQSPMDRPNQHLVSGGEMLPGCRHAMAEVEPRPCHGGCRKALGF